jgi:hypothetical protein
MTTTLSSQHQHTYDAVFQHPIAHNLSRRDVMAMLGELALVSQERNGSSKATRNGQTLVLHTSQDKQITDTDELLKIRHFLERSADSVATTPEDAGNILVVIDHREARVYKTEMHGTLPQRVVPYDPHGFGRCLRNNENDADGHRKPEQKSYYGEIAKTLAFAREILIFGGGTGESSAMEQLVAELRKNHHEIADRVVGTVALDAKHFTEDQLLKEARAFYEKREPQPTPA